MIVQPRPLLTLPLSPTLLSRPSLPPPPPLSPPLCFSAASSLQELMLFQASYFATLWTCPIFSVLTAGLLLSGSTHEVHIKSLDTLTKRASAACVLLGFIHADPLFGCVMFVFPCWAELKLWKWAFTSPLLMHRGWKCGVLSTSQVADTMQVLMKTMCLSIAPNWAIGMEFISWFCPDVCMETEMVLFW